MSPKSCCKLIPVTDVPKPMVEVKKGRHLTAQVLDLAKANNVSLRSYKVAVDHLADVENNAGPKEDICGIYGAVRVESGLDFYNHGPRNGAVNGKDPVTDVSGVFEKVL